MQIPIAAADRSGHPLSPAERFQPCRVAPTNASKGDSRHDHGRGNDRKDPAPSDEGDKRGLAFGHVEGDAFGRILKHMLEDVADSGRKNESGDYLIAYAMEKAEGMYVPKNGGFEWQAPTDENTHIEVAVRYRADQTTANPRARYSAFAG